MRWIGKWALVVGGVVKTTRDTYTVALGDAIALGAVGVSKKGGNLELRPINVGFTSPELVPVEIVKVGYWDLDF